MIMKVEKWGSGEVGRIGVRLAAVLALTFMPLAALAVDPCAFTAQCYSKQACDEVPGDFVVCSKKCLRGEGYCFSKRTEKIPLSVHIGTTKNVADLGDYIQVVYNFALGIAGAVAALMMMIGGFEYLTAAGDKGRVDAGKEKIKNAVIGLALALGAFTILNTINPDLLSLETPRVPLVKKRVFTQCLQFEGEVACGSSFGLSQDAAGKFKILDDPKSGDSIATCIGSSCAKVGKDDVNFSCKENTTSTPSVFACSPCVKDGESCVAGGFNDQCCSHFCGGRVGLSAFVGSFVCSTGDIGSFCADNSQCKSGLCQTRLGNSCSSGLMGVPCVNDTECRGGNVCVELLGLHVCQPSRIGSWCDPDSNKCPSGSQCIETARGAAKRIAQLTFSVATLPFGTATEAYCAKPGETTLRGCITDGACGSGEACAGAPGVCTDRLPGAPCDSDSDCVSNICVDSSTTSPVLGAPNGICSGGNIGDRCDDNNDCLSKHCYNKFTSTDFGGCVEGRAFSACTATSGCEPLLKCDTTNNRCVSKPSTP